MNVKTLHRDYITALLHNESVDEVYFRHTEQLDRWKRIDAEQRQGAQMLAGMMRLPEGSPERVATEKYLRDLLESIEAADTGNPTNNQPRSDLEH